MTDASSVETPLIWEVWFAFFWFGSAEGDDRRNVGDGVEAASRGGCGGVK